MAVNIELPNMIVGGILADSLANLLLEGNMHYMALFNDERTLVTLTGETQEIINSADTEVRRIIDIINGDIQTKSISLKFVHIPLVCNEKTRGLIDSHHLEISFTSGRIPFATLFPENRFHLTKDLQSIINPPNTPENISWFISRASISPADSLALEEMFQFGGPHVILSGTECMVDFKEMKLRSKTGEVASIHRDPPMAGFPRHNITMNIEGGKSYVDSAVAIMKSNIKEGMLTVPVTYESVFPPEYTSQLEQQIINFCRQFCIEICDTTGGRLNIKGAQNYTSWVDQQLYSHIEMLLLKFRALSAPLPVAERHHPVMIVNQPLVPATPSIYPSTWTPQIVNCVMWNVPPVSDEWEFVWKEMKKTLPHASLIKLERVQNKIIWERHLLEKKQMSEKNGGAINDMFLFHGTRKTNPYEVAKSDSGIDFRCSSQGGKLLWGTGAYFAVNASYSNNYAYKLADETRLLILVNVLTGFNYNYGGQKDSSLTRPPPYPSGLEVGARPAQLAHPSHRLYDTVRGNTGGSDVYVIYDHVKSYPAYIITYKLV